MADNFNKLMQEQVQERLNDFAVLAEHPAPKDGWIRTIREALGMSSYVLADRLGSNRSNVTMIEKREKKGTITLETLSDVAQALNCRLVYCLVPNEPLNIMLEKQAKLVAKKRIDRINHSMKLEDQGLTVKQLKKQEEDLIKELLQGSAKKLWNDKTVDIEIS
jgi:predicted DNA-binding mobile mystery protein A